MIDSLSGLDKFPGRVISLPLLEVLVIHTNQDLKLQPSSFGPLKNLKELHLVDMRSNKVMTSTMILTVTMTVTIDPDHISFFGVCQGQINVGGNGTSSTRRLSVSFYNFPATEYEFISLLCLAKNPRNQFD